MKLDHLTDGDLLSRLHALCLDARRIDVSLIVHLIEVEQRRLDLASACPSLYEFCVRRLGMSESAAVRRITMARLARRFPSLIDHLEGGRVHVSTLLLLRDHLNDENVEELVAAVSGKSKRQVVELIAARAPRPDVPTTLRKLPQQTATTTLPALPPLPEPPARIEPLAPARYALQVTVSAELRDKIDCVTNLMRHRNPSGDLATILEAGLDLLLALGGSGEASNLRVLCRAHNRWHAEQVFGRRHVERQIHLRQRRRRADVIAPHETANENVDAATRGLVNLGFRDAEARRTVQAVAARHPPAVPIEVILREAIGVLTSRPGSR